MYAAIIFLPALAGISAALDGLLRGVVAVTCRDDNA